MVSSAITPNLAAVAASASFRLHRSRCRGRRRRWEGGERLWAHLVAFDPALLKRESLLQVTLTHRRWWRRQVPITQFAHLGVITAEAVGTTAAIMVELEKAVEVKREDVLVLTAHIPCAGQPSASSPG